jgi:hypothetical protein
MQGLPCHLPSRDFAKGHRDGCEAHREQGDKAPAFRVIFGDDGYTSASRVNFGDDGYRDL